MIYHNLKSILKKNIHFKKYVVPKAKITLHARRKKNWNPFARELGLSTSWKGNKHLGAGHTAHVLPSSSAWLVQWKPGLTNWACSVEAQAALDGSTCVVYPAPKRRGRPFSPSTAGQTRRDGEACNYCRRTNVDFI